MTALSLSAAALLAAGIPDPVRIDPGLISGATSETSDVRAFKGIPFAAPPVGALRWRPPQPAADWAGVRKAEQFGARCMQATQNGGSPGINPGVSEDCLTINVWTAAKAASERRPVMVFFYGGGFNTGSGAQPGYDGEALAKKGVVFVTFNYRLGMFGFMAHPELTKESGHNSSGNYGMMDGRAALEWVQRNIGHFGGDPRKVTIMGESAGAMMVAALVGSPQGNGLFIRAIAESGAWMGLGPGKMTTLAAAEEVGAKAGTLADLRTKSAAEVLQSGRGSSIVVDGWYVPEDLSVTFRAGRQNPVDVLIGSNKDEGTFFSRGGVTLDQFTKQAKQRWSDQADSYLQLYPAANDEQANSAQLENTRDMVAWHMRVWAQMQSKRGNKAYLFYFTHEEPSVAGRPWRGATHTAELPFAFNNLGPGRNWTDAERKLADEMSSYWANFAATGDPNGRGLANWPPFKKDPAPMILGERAELVAGQKIAFYDAAYATQ